MTTVDAPNVHNVAIEGNFDDCQDLVKALFADPLRERGGLSAMNSINWARAAAQITYYLVAAAPPARATSPCPRATSATSSPAGSPAGPGRPSSG